MSVHLLPGPRRGVRRACLSLFALPPIPTHLNPPVNARQVLSRWMRLRSHCTAQGVCGPFAEDGQVVTGSDYVPCRVGSYLDRTTQRCTPRKSAGEACPQGEEQCAVNLRCCDRCAQPVCLRIGVKKAGEACFDGVECAAGLLCDEATSVCTPPPAIVGKRCSTDADCGTANDATCNTDACPPVCTVSNLAPPAQYLDPYLAYVNCAATHGCAGTGGRVFAFPAVHISPEGIRSCIRDHCLKEATALFKNQRSSLCPAQGGGQVTAACMSGVVALAVLLLSAL